MRRLLDHELPPGDLDRIDAMKQAPWIGYDKAINIRQQMDALVRHPRIERMPNIALIGDSNNGKSYLLRNFCKRHYPEDNLNAERITKPVMMVQTPPTADEGRLYYTILEALWAAGSPNEPDVAKLHRIKLIFEKLDVKVLILDDVFNIGSGTPNNRRKFLNALRNLGITMKVSIIASGTPETLNILSVDPSIANRFKPIYLPRWKVDRIEEFAKFVISIESSLGLKKPCDFRNVEFLSQLIIHSEGILGETVALLHLMAEHAIRTQTETIGLPELSNQTLKQLGWVKPSDRSRHFSD